MFHYFVILFTFISRSAYNQIPHKHVILENISEMKFLCPIKRNVCVILKFWNLLVILFQGEILFQLKIVPVIHPIKFDSVRSTKFLWEGYYDSIAAEENNDTAKFLWFPILLDKTSIFMTCYY